LTGYTKKLFLPYTEMVGESFRRGKAVALNIVSKEVELENGEKASEFGSICLQSMEKVKHRVYPCSS